MKFIKSLLLAGFFIGALVYLVFSILLIVGGNYTNALSAFGVCLVFLVCSMITELGFGGFWKFIKTGELPPDMQKEIDIKTLNKVNEVSDDMWLSDSNELQVQMDEGEKHKYPYDPEWENFQDLPPIGPTGSGYVDEDEIEDAINEAIRLARLGNYTAAEQALGAAENRVYRWEPYDTCDSYKGAGWQATIDDVQDYITRKKSEE